MDPAWLAIIVTVVIAIVAGLVAHVLHDAKAHERIARLEQKAEQHAERDDQQDREIHALREWKHDSREWVMKIVEKVYELLRNKDRP